MIYEISVEIRIPTKQYAYLSPIGKIKIEIPDTADDDTAAKMIERANRIALLGAQKQYMAINTQMKKAAEKKSD